MTPYSVYFMPDAVADLAAIYDYITETSGFPDVAYAYMQRLRQTCEGLTLAPERGTKRDDIRKNLRILALEKNAVAAFEVQEDKRIVIILNVFYGGRDYETLLLQEK